MAGQAMHWFDMDRALFGAAEVSEFGNGQVRTADSLVATIATHSQLLVMPQA